MSSPGLEMSLEHQMPVLMKKVKILNLRNAMFAAIKVPIHFLFDGLIVKQMFSS